MIPKETLEQIAAANDIVDVIGSYFPLKRMGGTFKTLCPFHQEKSPSFIVNPQRQRYHCFGCGEGGSVFDFVAKFESVDFPTAARRRQRGRGITSGNAGSREQWPGGGRSGTRRMRGRHSGHGQESRNSSGMRSSRADWCRCATQRIRRAIFMIGFGTGSCSRFAMTLGK